MLELGTSQKCSDVVLSVAERQHPLKRLELAMVALSIPTELILEVFDVESSKQREAATNPEG
jgi:hypothetical protein